MSKPCSPEWEPDVVRRTSTSWYWSCDCGTSSYAAFDDEQSARVGFIWHVMVTNFEISEDDSPYDGEHPNGYWETGDY